MDKARVEALNKLKGRYSCRSFSKEKIEDSVLDEILSVGLAAASGGNLQPVSIIKVRDQEKKDKIRDLCKQGFIAEADTLLIFLVDYFRLLKWSEVQKAPFGRHNSFVDFIIALEDVMCMAQSIENAATLLDIGSVYIGTVNYVYEELKELLDLPKMTIPVLMTCLGKPDTSNKNAHLKGHLSKKLAKKVIVHEEGYKKLTNDEVNEYIVKDKYDNWKLELGGDVLEKYKEELYGIAKEVNGEEWAKKVLNRIIDQKGLNRAQFRLGHHYNPIRLRALNKKIFKFYKDQGFNFWTIDDE
ncbi:MAG: nitroreductase family protein [Clostridia bacterium]